MCSRGFQGRNCCYVSQKIKGTPKICTSKYSVKAKKKLQNAMRKGGKTEHSIQGMNALLHAQCTGESIKHSFYTSALTSLYFDGCLLLSFSVCAVLQPGLPNDFCCTALLPHPRPAPPPGSLYHSHCSASSQVVKSPQGFSHDVAAPVPADDSLRLDCLPCCVALPGSLYQCGELRTPNGPGSLQLFQLQM